MFRAEDEIMCSIKGTVNVVVHWYSVYKACKNVTPASDAATFLIMPLDFGTSAYSGVA